MAGPSGILIGIPANWEEMDQVVAALQAGTSTALIYPRNFDELHEFVTALEAYYGIAMGIPANWGEVEQSFSILQQHLNGL